ncbi:hypothetical protein LSTR_LSTR009105 [Laodelphax striatellus]|uniref:Uncharacterized protein n=1 Tax=Laodelphax striatellus TaxID=195883 RepID=A0A482XN61_LAOST|nr:hypothetical protein LSTR_LSTR009105 [Laodelphax striatellus]
MMRQQRWRQTVLAVVGLQQQLVVYLFFRCSRCCWCCVFSSAEWKNSFPSIVHARAGSGRQLASEAGASRANCSHRRPRDALLVISDSVIVSDNDTTNYFHHCNHILDWQPPQGGCCMPATDGR